jgi:hypothetical protein
MTKLHKLYLYLFSSLVLAFASPAAALAYTVTSTADSGAGSLRYGVDTSTDDAIDFDAANNGTDYVASGGQFVIARNLSIAGNGAANTTINAGDQNRIFQVQSGIVFNLSGVTLTGGKADGAGGAIYNEGNTTVNDSVLTHNSAVAYGGAVANLGTMKINDSTIDHNSAECAGGILNGIEGPASLEVQNSTISFNQAQSSEFCSDGGGILNYDTLKLTNSSLSYNFTSGEGGGLASHGGTTTIVASTINNNGAEECGGGIYAGNIQSLDMTNVTIAFNESSQCGGGLALESSDSAQLTNVTIAYNSVNTPQILSEVSFSPFGTVGGGGVAIEHPFNICDLFPFLCGDFVQKVASTVNSTNVVNSIIANNTYNQESSDCTEQLNSQGDNLDSDGSCFSAGGGNLPNTNPLLDTELRDNGGPTLTLALLPGSPAIDADACPPPFTDQRGVLRPQGARCDMGAFELENIVGGGIAQATTPATALAHVGGSDDPGGLPKGGQGAAILFVITGLGGLYYALRWRRSA